jgi:predicted metal-dependent phosphoesterase TrpH
MCPNSTIDLHLHTHYSDGIASPTEVLHYASNYGLRTVSITDHENINAFQEASFIAAELGLELIPGIELTGIWEECVTPGDQGTSYIEIDILGYFINVENPELLAFAHMKLEDLKARITECCRLITGAGFPITIFDVLDQNPRFPGEVPLIMALMHKGYARDRNAAFQLFTSYWREVRKSPFRIEQIIATIHSAGGLAVLAHPVLVECGEGWLQAEQVRRLKEMGLDGLEVYHPRIDAKARAHFHDLALQFDLVETGGSDEHGWRGGFLRMGSEPIPYSVVDNLRDRSERLRP